MNESYHKARRLYGLFSGLLLAAELIGLSLKEDLSDTFGAKLANPEAVPFVLLVLITYSCIRVSLEWYQNEENAKHALAGRIDVWFSHSVAAFAASIFITQHILGVKIAEMRTEIAIAAAVHFVSPFLSMLITRWIVRKRSIMATIVAILILAGHIFLLSFPWGGRIFTWHSLVSVCFGSSLYFLWIKFRIPQSAGGQMGVTIDSLGSNP